MDPILVDIAKQSPMLGLLVWLLKRGMEEGRVFLSTLREIQTEAREDAREARETMRSVQQESMQALEKASVAIARSTDATRSLERRLERFGVPPENYEGSD